MEFPASVGRGDRSCMIPFGYGGRDEQIAELGVILFPFRPMREFAQCSLPCKDHKVDLDLGSISFLSFSFWRPRDGDAGAVSKSARDFYTHGTSPGMANLTRIEASFPPCSVSL
jgi:hypothetical protein